MRAGDLENELDGEITRLKLRDIVIGSAVAAVLLAMMPGHVSRSAAPVARARVATPLLPKPKSVCAKGDTRSAHCPAQPGVRHHAMMEYPSHRAPAPHIVDIRV